jgi:hypothetical protein
VIQRSDERVKETGEVFTPAALVQEVLDTIEPDAWSDPTRTWLEPSCGDGNFLKAIHDRLMIGLSPWEPDSVKLHAHIIENMLFGVDLMSDNVEACILRLDATGLNHNIVCADALTYDYAFGKTLPVGELAEINGEDPAKVKERNDLWGKRKKPKITASDLRSDLFG